MIIGGREISRPYPNVGYRLEKFDAVFYQEIILSPGVFRRETASGFYPWGNVVSPRERVAEGLCGWRHGNSFPMTQSAQSHRQMRSIPRCSKAVFYVFVFDSIHDSTTLSKSMPTEFFTETSKTLIFASDITCNQPKQANTLAKHFGLGGDLVAWGKICNFTGD